MPGASVPWDRQEAAGLGLAVDAAAAEAVGALNDAGIASILLKGASFERWLYEPDEPRMYGDVDLLVAPGDVDRAAPVLERLGYTPRSEERSPTHVDHAKLWVRAGDSMHLDLHRSLVGLAAGVDAWEVLSEQTERLEVGGAEVEVLSPPAKALQVALHATVHADDPVKPLEDLSRALDRAGRATWEQATGLARRLGAEGAFAAGLCQLPAGQDMAERLGLSAERTVETVMFTRSVPYSSWTVNRLANTPGLGPKLRIVLRRTFPEPSFMRAWYPVARRGRGGLAFSYVRRLLWLFTATGPAVLAWVRARREARGGQDDELRRLLAETLDEPVTQLERHRAPARGNAVARLLNRWWWNVRTALEELAFGRGLDTAGQEYRSEHLHPERVRYEPSGWTYLGRVLDRDEVRPDDVFVDFGSGKGRVVYQAARFPFARVIGVEVSEELNEVARRNIERKRAQLVCQDVELVTCDAAAFQVPDDMTHAYFYFPFVGDTFGAVVANILASLDRRPRTVKLIYACPNEQQQILESGRFRLLRTSRGGRRDVEGRRIAVYTNEGVGG